LSRSLDLFRSRYFFFGGEIEQDDREREEMGMGKNEGSMKFVYAWLIVMFFGLTVFAMRSMWVGRDRLGLIVSLLIFGQFSLLNLLTSIQAISSDNRDLEDSVYGWYGQYSVLLAYTDFWIMLHCFLAAGALGLLRCFDKRKASKAEAVQEDVEDKQYNAEMSYRRSVEETVTNQRNSFGYA